MKDILTFVPLDDNQKAEGRSVELYHSFQEAFHLGIVNN